MTEKHHTEEQVAKAFAYAPTVLRKLTEAGVQLPSLTLYADASGTLSLGESVTSKQYELAVSLVRSQRQSMHCKGVSINFCCGLVTAGEESN